MPKNIKKVLKKKKARSSSTLPLIAMLAALGVSSLTYSVTTVSADSTTSATKTTSIHMMKGKRGSDKAGYGVGGTITNISGTNITVTAKDQKTYTIDAAAAKFVRRTLPAVPTTVPPTGPRLEPIVTTIALADLQVGNTIMIQGTVSGTSVTATQITVGTFNQKSEHASGNVKERVKPAAAGIVQSVDGAVVTIKDRDGKVFTVDTTGAKILQGGRGQASTTATVADIKVGNMLGAQGVLTGTNVVATEVMTGPQHPFMQKLHEKKLTTGK